MHREKLGNSHLSSRQEGFTEAERKSLSDLCSESNGIWQRDVGNEGRGYAKTRKNREDDDQMDVWCKTEL